MKVTLLVDYLEYISLGTGKIHARDLLHDATHTMCGRAMMSGAEIRPHRSLSRSALCGRCSASLTTYTGRLGSVPKVRVEQEVQV